MWNAENSNGINGSEVLRRTVCLELKTSVFGTVRKVSTDKVEVTPEAGEAEARADKALLRVSKRIIDSPELSKIMVHVHTVRTRMRQLSVPTTIFRYGCYGVPIRLVDRVDEILNIAEREFNSLVSDFVAAYPRLVREAAERLGELYSPTDYPTADQVRDRFAFKFAYSTFDVPSTLQGISSALFQREREKAEARWSEAGTEIRDALRVGFAGMVDKMMEILTPGEDGKPKTFRRSSIDGFREFMATFEGRNVTDDAELSALVDKARRILDGASLESIRRDEPIRERLLERFEEVKTAVAPMVVSARREIHFDDEV
jgi:hypothetical protein